MIGGTTRPAATSSPVEGHCTTTKYSTDRTGRNRIQEKEKEYVLLSIDRPLGTALMPIGPRHTVAIGYGGLWRGRAARRGSSGRNGAGSDGGAHRHRRAA